MLEIPVGDEFSLQVVIEDPETGLPVDITGATVFFTIKKMLAQDDASAVVVKNVSSHTDPTNGETEIELSSTDNNVPEGEYYWSLRVKFSTGDILTAVPNEKMRYRAHATRRTS